MNETMCDGTACFVFDMMQNQPLPRTALGEAFYCRQQNKTDVSFYTWGENYAMRGSYMFALHYITICLSSVLLILK